MVCSERPEGGVESVEGGNVGARVEPEMGVMSDRENESLNRF